MPVVGLLAGCDRVWGFEDVRAGMPDADPGCFQDRVMLQDLTGNVDPTLRDDGLELFFVRGGSGAWDIWHATRPDTSVLFDAGSPVTELNVTTGMVEDTDPAITADGLMIVFKSNRTSSQKAYQATRPSVSAPFSTPVLAPGITGATAGLDLSPDGLVIYIDDFAKLSVWTRARREDAFANPKLLTIDRLKFPSVSADGLELYYNAAGIVRRTRPNVDAMFDGGTAAIVDDGASDGDLTSDDTRLVLIGNDRIMMRPRCM